MVLDQQIECVHPKTSRPIPGILLHPDLLMLSCTNQHDDVESVGTSMLLWHSPIIITKSIVAPALQDQSVIP